MSTSINKPLDEMDIIILNLLQKESQLSNAELSRKVNLSPPATHARIKRLEKEGYIDKYAVILNKDKLGFDLICYIFININTHQIKQHEEFERKITAMPQILECSNLTGEYDYLLKAILRNRTELQVFVRELTLFPSVSRIQTSVTMKEIKYSTTVPIGILLEE